MATNYEVCGWARFAVEDSFARGELGTERCSFGTERFSSGTIKGVIEKCRRFCNADEDCVSRDSCGVRGRLDISVMEDGDGGKASPDQLEEWRLGKRRLWSATYTFMVEKVARHPASLSEPAVSGGECRFCGRVYDDMKRGKCPSDDCPSNEKSEPEAK